MSLDILYAMRILWRSKYLLQTVFLGHIYTSNNIKWFISCHEHKFWLVVRTSWAYFSVFVHLFPFVISSILFWLDYMNSTLIGIMLQFSPKALSHSSPVGIDLDTKCFKCCTGLASSWSCCPSLGQCIFTDYSL